MISQYFYKVWIHLAEGEVRYYNPNSVQKFAKLEKHGKTFDSVADIEKAMRYIKKGLERGGFGKALIVIKQYQVMLSANLKGYSFELGQLQELPEYR